jgi:enamine deaminase RidA (YjgF/YER057c/UK114 family)
MNELINLIVQKTGISQENAQKAAQTAIDFLKTKLPAPIAGQVDAVLAGDMSGIAGQAGEMLKGKLGGALGEQK